MKLSARNALEGTVKQIQAGRSQCRGRRRTRRGPAGRLHHHAAIRERASGRAVYAVIKASSVMVGVDH